MCPADFRACVRASRLCTCARVAFKRTCACAVGWFSHYRIKEHLVQCSHSALPHTVAGEITHCCIMQTPAPPPPPLDHQSPSLVQVHLGRASYRRHDGASQCQLGEQIWIGRGKRAGMELRRGDAALRKSGKACIVVKKKTNLPVASISGGIRTGEDGQICFGANSQDRERSGGERAAKTDTDRDRQTN